MKDAKSVCRCGHSGDSTPEGASEHAGLVGHGCCLVGGCRCAKFTWAKWTDAFESEMARIAAAGSKS